MKRAKLGGGGRERNGEATEGTVPSEKGKEGGEQKCPDDRIDHHVWLSPPQLSGEAEGPGNQSIHPGGGV